MSSTGPTIPVAFVTIELNNNRPAQEEPYAVLNEWGDGWQESSTDMSYHEYLELVSYVGICAFASE